MAICWLILASFNSSAQILTIDKTDTACYQRKTVLKGAITLNFEADKQKKLLLDASNFMDIMLQRNKELIILASSYRCTYNNKVDFLNSGFIHLRWRHRYKNKWHPESFMQYQWEYARGLLHRYVAGENIRYNFWYKNHWELVVATGLMYENERWNYNGVEPVFIPLIPQDQFTHVFKSNNYIRWEGKLSTASSLSAVVFFQTPFARFACQFRIASNMKLTFAISKHFNIALNLNSLYDTDPVIPIIPFYYNFSNSVIYKF